MTAFGLGRWRLAVFFLLLRSPCWSQSNDIHTVWIVFSTHLDIGFGGYSGVPVIDSGVISAYFQDHLPHAIRVAQKLRQRGRRERFVYTTHSWLIALFLDCPSGRGIKCPSRSAIAAFEAAVRRGDITWRAAPHNAQVELFDRELLAYAFNLTHALDDRFGLPRKLCMSQRDVPGLTRAALPTLVRQGVRALSVGVNGGSASPAVPHNTPFWWRDEPSGSQVLAFWHPGGYSGKPVDEPGECVRVHGHGAVACLAWRDDNLGPQSVREVLQVYRRMRRAWPHARVRAGGLDRFVAPLLEAAPNLSLPVVTAEIGDTWIYGAASDPGKISEYRMLLRARRVAPRSVHGTSAFARFSLLLLKLPEHTWGANNGAVLGDFVSWSNVDFARQLRRGARNFRRIVASWVHQRAYAQWAADALGDTRFGRSTRAALNHLHASWHVPRTGGHGRVPLDRAVTASSRAWRVRVDRRSGAITSLVFGGGTAAVAPSAGPASRRAALMQAPHRGALDWASGERPFGTALYSTYGEHDYDTIWKEYTYTPDPLPWGFQIDFGKPNATVCGGARRRDFRPRLMEAWRTQDKDGAGFHVILKSTFQGAAVRDAGAPRALWTELRSQAGSDALLVDVVWEDKTATRLPEALWWQWVPGLSAVRHETWRMDKLGARISPLGIALNGSHAMHAVGDSGISVDAGDGSARLHIRSLDAVLVSPGQPTPFPVLRRDPDLRHGMSFCLHNNIWGTNYPTWYPYQRTDSTMRFRFVLEVEILPAVVAAV